MKEGRHIILRDKREIILQDDNDILLSILSKGRAIHSFSVPYPFAGYGGGTLLLSLSEQYLLFSYYSGQSEEAYILFRICNSCLEPVYKSGYLCGEGASYIFSDSENLLLQALPASLGPWYIKESAQTDANGISFFQYGEINIFDIKQRKIKKYMLHVYPDQNWEEDMAEADPFYISAITDDFLSLAMPWGEEKLIFPLEDIIILSSEIKIVDLEG